MLKKIVKISVLLLLIMSMLSACNKNAVAIVNGESITREDFQNELNNEAQTIEKQNGTIDWTSQENGTTLVKELRQQVLQTLVQEKVQLQEAKKEGVKVSDSTVEQQAQHEIDTEILYVGGQDTFNSMLKDQKMTQTQYKDLLEASYKKILTIQALENKLTKGITVTEEQAQNYYNTHKLEFKPDTVTAKHILVSDLKTANLIEDKLKGGAKFDDMAKQYSIDTSTKDDGGNLGSFTYGQMVKEFEDAAFKLKVGQISAPVKTQYGYHIIMVTNRKDAAQQTFAQSKSTIMSNLLSQAKDSKYQTYVNGWAKKAKVQTNDSMMNNINITVKSS